MRKPRPAALFPAIVLSAFLALLVACTPALPSPAPVATAAPWTDMIVPGNAVTVTVDELAIRAEPSGAADSTGSLARGDVAVVQSFPVVSEGTVWYYVMKVPTAGPGRLPELPAPVVFEDYALVGYVAASGAAGGQLARTALRCPMTVDYDNVSAMLAGERLACFGPARITVDGNFACEDCSGGELGTHAPEWLAGHGGGSLSDPSDVDRRPVPLFFPPGVAAPEHDAFVRVTGHLDDPGARTCVMDPVVMLGDEADLLAADAFAEVTVQLCRQRFVVDAFEVLSAEEIQPPD